VKTLLFSLCGPLDQALGAGVVFVSHSHIDHIGALLNHARARTLGNKPAKYYVPEAAVAPLLQAKAAFETLDGCIFSGEILGVQPGARPDEMEGKSHTSGVIVWG
jgi:glyoxylase-like metal-dependent hydrolase (beta-lactamase superfamily II)